MDLWEFDKLKIDIAARLATLGPATADKLALDLNAPHGNVRSALEELWVNEKSVKRLAFGFWDVAEEVPRVA